MTTEEIKLKFPIGKLYRIKFDTSDDDFGAKINNKTLTFSSRETVFLMLDIECDGVYYDITALFASGQIGTISYIFEKELKML